MAHRKMNKIKFNVIWVVYSLVALILVVLAESKIVSPAILHEDPCHYHNNGTPWAIELFYMNGASNGHPDGSFTLLFTMLGISMLIGRYMTKRIHFQKKLKQTTTPNKANA